MIRFGFLVCLASALLTTAQAQNAAGPDSVDLSPEPSVQSESDTEYVATEGHVVENRRSYLQENSEKNTLSRNYAGLGSRVNDRGINSTLNLWMLYQANVSGGISEDEDLNGLVYFSNFFDLDRTFGWNDASFLIRIDGRWGDGIDASVGSLMNVNTLAVGDEPIGVTRLWFDKHWLQNHLRLRIGKLDITTENFDFHGTNTAFDAMNYANSPRTQFLGAALVNNSSIPFPESGLGAMLLYEPVDRFYVAGGAIPSDSKEYDWSNPFGSNSVWLYTAETGTVVDVGADDRPGHYYAGVWSGEFVNARRGKGVYVGASQLLIGKDGSQQNGLGVFFRYGYAQDHPKGIEHFVSFGGQYRGLMRGLDQVVGIGWAQAFTDGPGFTASYEGVLEVYYRGRFAPAWLHLTPHIQYVVNPGSQDISNAWTLGLRVQVTF
jgi:carbohydrate-selective porin OprB